MKKRATFEDWNRKICPRCGTKLVHGKDYVGPEDMPVGTTECPECYWFAGDDTDDEWPHWRMEK